MLGDAGRGDSVEEVEMGRGGEWVGYVLGWGCRRFYYVAE